jgi:hypothetical protein
MAKLGPPSGRAELVPYLARRDRVVPPYEWVMHQLERVKKGSVLEGQKQMLAAVLEFEHRFPDLHMRTSNELYTRSLREVRQLEARAAALDPLTDRAAIDGLLARTKTLATDAVFFANEAYLSEGPYQHVVKATQAVLTAAKALSEPERSVYIKEHTAEELATLSANQLLQSFNEQLGDLLKDLAHYAAEGAPWSGFYRSSKYVERLLDAALLLQQKVPDLDLAMPSTRMTTSEIKARVSQGLLAARKGSSRLATVEPSSAAMRCSARSTRSPSTKFARYLAWSRCASMDGCSSTWRAVSMHTFAAVS